MKLLLSLAVNKQRIQLLVGTDLIQNASQTQTITVSGVFEDPTDIRSNKLSAAQLEPLKCDHEEADTRVVRSVLMSDLPRSVIYANDTDILISTLAQVDRLPNKEIFMRMFKNDFLDVSGIGQGLIDLRLNLQSLVIYFILEGSDHTSFMHNRGKTISWTVFLKHHVSSILP